MSMAWSDSWNSPLRLVAFARDVSPTPKAVRRLGALPVPLFAPTGLFYQISNPFPSFYQCRYLLQHAAVAAAVEARSSTAVWKLRLDDYGAVVLLPRVMVLLLSQLRGVVGMGATAGSTARLRGRGCHGRGFVVQRSHRHSYVL